MNKQLVIIATSLVCALAPLPAQIVTNGSFESPDIPDNSFDLSGSQGGWTFAGNAGINDPFSGYSSPEAPDGQQFALLQTSGTAFLSNFSRPITLPSTGAFTLSFFDAGRASGTGFGDLIYDVFLDGTIIFTGATSTAQLFTLETAPFAGTAGAHILKFQVNAADTGIGTAFFDAITIVPEPSTYLLAAVGAILLAVSQRRRAKSSR